MNPSKLIANEIFGIDPGKNGGIVKYTDIFQSFRLGAMHGDISLMCEWFKEQSKICTNPLVMIEKITTFSSDHGKSNENKQERSRRIGRAYQLQKMKDHYAELMAAIKLSKIQYIEVMPMTWETYLSIRIKGEEYHVRKRRHKDLASDFATGHKITAWNADAVLLVEFARRKIQYDKRWVLQQLKKTSTKQQRLQI